MPEKTLLTKKTILILISIIIVGLNLRPSMAAIGPLLSLIRDSVPMNFSTISLLTVLPVLSMGLAMILGAKLTEKLGEYKSIIIGLSLIGVSSVFRQWCNSSEELIITAVIAGCGIAIIQAIFPGVIKRKFKENIPLVMGIYVTSIMGGAALAASISPFVSAIVGWQVGLSMWASLSVLAIILWSIVKKDIHQEELVQATVDKNISDKFYKHKRAWLLGIFFGLGTSFYTCVLAWLPPYYLDLGYEDTNAGLMLAFVCAMEVLSGLVLPAIASKSNDRRIVLIVTLISIILGFGGLILTPTKLPLLWASLLGIGIGGIFPLTLIVTMDHIHETKRSTKLTAFVQSIGYTIAAFSPLGAGVIRDLTNGFTGAWATLLVVTIIMLFMAIKFNPVKYDRIFSHS